MLRGVCCLLENGDRHCCVHLLQHKFFSVRIRNVDQMMYTQHNSMQAHTYEPYFINYMTLKIGDFFAKGLLRLEVGSPSDIILLIFKFFSKLSQLDVDFFTNSQSESLYVSGTWK